MNFTRPAPAVAGAVPSHHASFAQSRISIFLSAA
jgi:hypothetical protein